MLNKVRLLNVRLSQCKTQVEKCEAFYNFTQELNDD